MMSFIDSFSSIPNCSFLNISIILITCSFTSYFLHSYSSILLFFFLSISHTESGHIMDRAKHSHGGSFSNLQVEGVKLVLRLTPFLLVMIPFWGIYSQMSTAFQNQACQMNLYFNSNKTGMQVPVSALNSFDTIAIIILVPIFDKFVYPYFKRKGYPLTMLIKIGLGFAFALLAMIIAAIIEVARLDLAPTPGNYYDVSARDNITPCQSLDDYNPYRYQVRPCVGYDEGRTNLSLTGL